ncbi:MAG: ATP-binding protein [bacterium]
MIDDFSLIGDSLQNINDRFQSYDISVNICPKCSGSGWIFELSDGRRTAKRCDCYLDKRIKVLHRYARIPEKYNHCTLESFEIDDENGAVNRYLARANQIAREFINLYPTLEKGLLFIGPCGVGKTHLAVGILKKLIEEKGAVGLFYDFRDLLRMIRRTYSSDSIESEFDITDPVLSADILVLDELGSIKTTDWALDMLTHIIIRRYNDNKTLIVTSNYLDEPAREGDERLEDRISYRLRSRLYEMCVTVDMRGPDYRRRIGQKNTVY